jgi:hypothetical protein
MGGKLEKKLERFHEKAEAARKERDPQKAADLVVEGVELKREVDEKLGELLPEAPGREQ